MSLLDSIRQAAMNALREAPGIGSLVRATETANAIADKKKTEEILARATRPTMQSTVPQTANVLRTVQSGVQRVTQNPAVQSFVKNATRPENVLAQQQTERRIMQGPIATGAELLSSVPALRAGGSLLGTAARAVTKSPVSLPGNALIGNEPVRDLQQNIQRAYSGEGLGGSAANFLQSKANIPKLVSAPAIALGALALDLTPGGADDAAKAGVRLIDEAGKLRNVVMDTGRVLNQADILSVISRSSKVDDASTIVQRADGALRILAGNKVDDWIKANEGANILGTVREAADKLGYKSASDYVSDGLDFIRQFRVSQTDSTLKARNALTPEETAKITTTPFEPMRLNQTIDDAVASIEDPMRAALDFQPIKNADDAARGVAILEKLDSLPASAAREAAKRAVMDNVQSGAGTQAAQLLRAMRELRAQRGGLVSDYESLVNAFNDAHPGNEIKLSEEYQNVLKAVQESLKDPKLDSFAKSRMLTDISKRIYAVHPELQSFSDVISNYWRSSILSSPATAVANVIGSAATQLVEAPANLLRQAATKFTPANKYFANTPTRFDVAANTARQMGRDFLKNTNSFAGDSTELLRSTGGYVAPAEGANILQKAAEAGSQRLASTSQLFAGAERPLREAANAGKIDELVQVAQKLGLDTEDAKVFADIEKLAQDETDFLFFTNNGWLKQIFTGARDLIRGEKAAASSSTAAKVIAPVRQFLADSLIPFAEVPANIVARGVVDYTPLGVLRSASAISEIFTKGNKLSPIERVGLVRKAIQSASRAGTGTALVSTLALFGAYSGSMIFGRPKDQKTRDLYAAQNIPANAVNITGMQRALNALINNYKTTGKFDFSVMRGVGSFKDGDSVISYNYLQPLAIPLSAAGVYAQNILEGSDNDVGKAADAAVQTVIEHPLFRSLSTVGDIKTYGLANAIKQYAGSTAGGFIPGMMSFFAQATDLDANGNMILRENKSASAGENILNQIRSRVPMLRQQVPQAVDIAGQGLTQPLGASILRDLVPRDINMPLSASAGLKLDNVLDDTGAIPTRIQPTGTVANLDYKLSSSDLKNARRIYGETTSKVIEALTKNPEFLALSRNDQANKIQSLYSEVQKQTLAVYAARDMGLIAEFPMIPPTKWITIFESLNSDVNNPMGQNALSGARNEEDKKAIIRAYLTQALQNTRR